MKFEFIKEFSSKDFLGMSLECRYNSIVMKDSANLLFKNKSSKNHGLFLLHTSMEELQKSVFCMFVHRDFMKSAQITPVFSKHEAKIILFEKIFENPKFMIKKGEFWLDGMPLKLVDLDEIIKNNTKISRQYMENRNDCLYVKPVHNGNWHNPSKTIVDIDSKKEKILDELSYLNNFLQIIWSNDFEGDLENFYYYKLTPKGKPKTYNITFSGTGIITEREKYKLEDIT